MKLWMRHATVALLLSGGAGATAVDLLAQAPNQVPYEATKLIGRWRTVMNNTLEEARAFAPENVIDLMEEFVSPGAVRAIKDKATEAQLKDADRVLERFVYAIVKAGARQPDGSVLLDESAIEPGVKAICPVYPFCEGDANK